MLDHLAHLLGEMAGRPDGRLADLSLSGPDRPTTLAPPDRGSLPAGVDRLSDEEVDAMLAELSSEEGATFE